MKSEKNKADFLENGFSPIKVSAGAKLSKKDCTKLLGLLSVSDCVNKGNPIPSLKNVLLHKVRLLPVSVIIFSQTFILPGNSYFFFILTMPVESLKKDPWFSLSNRLLSFIWL